MISLRLSMMLVLVVTVNGGSIFAGKSIIFPEPGTAQTADVQTENVTAPSCGNQTGVDYCIDPPNYPEENILKTVLRKGGILRSFFEDESSNSISKEALPLSIGIIQGLSYDDPAPEFENVCNMRIDHIMPRAAKNTRGKFMFIVNNLGGNSSFIQKVQVGECVSSGKECGDGSIFDRKTECRQEFLEHKLVSVSQDGEQVIVDTFKFPSCCTCYVRLKYEL